MEKHYKYHLEKYHGRASRHECPRCHDKRSFTYYVDDGGNILDETVGKCNHESRCGYHYTPKEFFKDHGVTDQSKAYTYQVQPRPQEPPRPISYIDPSFVVRSKSKKSYFVDFLKTLFAPGIVDRLVEAYKIGATRDHSVIFWQIDIEGKVRTGKKIMYDPVTGHRKKNGFVVDWIHAIMKRHKMVGEDYNLCQCLFGEHLLAEEPTKTVALVEAEKTAVICAGVYPGYTWLATGGMSQLRYETMKVLQGRNVIVFPDIGATDDWRERLRTYTFAAFHISGLLENQATKEEREAKIDIADWIIKDLKQKKERPELKALIAKNPAIRLLVDKYDLEVIRCEK